MDNQTQMIKVLGGHVRLIDWMGGDLSIVRAARNSHDAAWRTGIDGKSDDDLINYLMKNRHTTPFEAVTFTFGVKAPIFVFRQWHRHRTWSYNEVSARYTELPEEFYVPDVGKIGLQSESNKQGRVIEKDEVASQADDLVRSTMEAQIKTAFDTYHRLLELNVPRELARIVLPLATYSHMFATVNLHNLFHFIGLRSHEHAQYEIRVYSDAMLELAKSIVPIAVDAFKKNRK